MRLTETISSTPITVEKSVRADEVRVLTSGKAGKILPIAYIPLLREDRVSRGSIRLSLQMAETLFPLMNAVNVTAYAHLVPYTAFERFDGSLDDLNRSYAGVGRGEDDPISFFLGHTFQDSHQIYKTMGIHHVHGTDINRAVLEAYNTVVNFRRRARSKSLAERTALDTSLAQAFWKNPDMYHIVPDFDQAMMDGQVQLTFADVSLPLSVDRLDVMGLQRAKTDTGSSQVENVPGSRTGSVMASRVLHQPVNGSGEGVIPYVDLQAVFAEMTASGASISLANIDLAKKTAAFAKLREQYAGIDDEHLIDLLMQGIRVPDEAMKQPILLDRQSTIFGYTERHAMDGDSLEKSVTTGVTNLSLNFRTPPINTGGIIMVTVEIVPEQLFERKRDFFLANLDVSKLPDFTRDFLDPEKVDVVPNSHVDVHHGTPNGTFGYAPLNHVWKRSLTRIGGRYLRPLSSSFVEDRQRFWSIEQVNPSLTSDFYMCPQTFPHTVFADAAADPFEVLALGRVEIVGNTVFGRELTEDGGHYEAVAEKVDHTRINQG